MWSKLVPDGIKHHPFVNETLSIKFLRPLSSVDNSTFSSEKLTHRVSVRVFVAIPPVKFTKQRRQTAIIVSFNMKRLFCAFEHYHLWCFRFSRLWMKTTRASRQWSEIMRRFAVCLWFGSSREKLKKWIFTSTKRPQTPPNQIFMRAVSIVCDAWSSSTRLAEVKQRI